MFESSSPTSEPLPLRLSILSRNSISNTTPSQKKKRKSLSLKSSMFDEENTLQMPSSNLIIKTRDSNCNLLLNENSNKSPRIEYTDTGTSDQTEINTTESSSDHTNENTNDGTWATACSGINNKDNMKNILITSEINDNRYDENVSYPKFNPTQRLSNCGTEVSSVLERKEWLQSFEKQDFSSNDSFRSSSIVNENKFFNDQARDNGNSSNKNEARIVREETRQYPSPSPQVVRLTNNDEKQTPVKHLQRTPITSQQGSNSVMVNSWRKGIKKEQEQVKATDTGHASVASLSKWLESDPTSEKKKRHVRRGRNVISKSRQFEKDLESVVIMESNISRGAVGNKKKWLQSAFKSSFGENHDEDDTSSIFSGYVQSDVGLSARSYTSYNRKGTQTEIITNDAASSLSVADKKDWLKEAFSKKSQERKKLGGCTSRAQTDVMCNRGKSRDNVASRAKMRFKERSSRKLLNNTSSASSSLKVETVSNKNTALASSSSIIVHNKPKNVLQSNTTSDTDSVFRSKAIIRIANNIEEDTTSVGFRRAREALVQRSKKNGHSVEVVNKVLLRKKKFEKMEAESRRKSMGLVLKPSWDLGNSSKGRPSTVYEKRFFQDIAPKKSFEELP